MDKPEMFRISEELEAMPELEKIQRIHVQRLNYYVFQRNTEELRQTLSFHSDVENDMPLWDVDNRDSLTSLQYEVVRLLHNFVVAAFSLVDTTRRFSKQYVSVFPDYQTKVSSEFATDPLTNFVQGLRNYVVHYEAPHIVSELNFSFVNQSMVSQIVLPSAILLKNTNWTKPAKKYIADCGDKIVLNAVVDDYFKKVSDFYDWFYKRLNEIHEVDLERIAAKQEELKQAYIEHPAGPLGEKEQHK